MHNGEVMCVYIFKLHNDQIQQNLASESLHPKSFGIFNFGSFWFNIHTLTAVDA